VVDRSPLALDGSYGEGGGQVLRTALALAVALARPVRLERIRARRANPGLRPQHQTVVRALAEVSDAVVEGDEIGSTAVSFAPRGLRGGEYRFTCPTVSAHLRTVTWLVQQFLPVRIELHEATSSRVEIVPGGPLAS